jgi:hypothetical protein
MQAILNGLLGVHTLLKSFGEGFSLALLRFAVWLGKVFLYVLRYYKVWFGIACVIVTMTKTSLLFAFQMVAGVFLTLDSAFGGIQGLQAGSAFSGSPFAPAMSFVNAFLPLTELLAAIVALWAIWIVCIGIRFGVFLVDRFKIWVFQWV